MHHARMHTSPRLRVCTWGISACTAAGRHCLAAWASWACMGRQPPASPRSRIAVHTTCMHHMHSCWQALLGCTGMHGLARSMPFAVHTSCACLPPLSLRTHGCERSLWVRRFTAFASDDMIAPSAAAGYLLWPDARWGCASSTLHDGGGGNASGGGGGSKPPPLAAGLATDAGPSAGSQMACLKQCSAARRDACAVGGDRRGSRDGVPRTGRSPRWLCLVCVAMAGSSRRLGEDFLLWAATLPESLAPRLPVRPARCWRAALESPAGRRGGRHTWDKTE
eukprot:358334-Chlamydomonas_euryale.AAC.6